MKKNLLSLLVLICLHNTLMFGSEAEIKEQASESAHPFGTHGMLIFLDDSETTMDGAITSLLFAALEQKAGPILFSYTAMYNILNQQTIEEQTHQAQAVIKRLENRNTPEKSATDLQALKQKYKSLEELKKHYDTFKRELSELKTEDNNERTAVVAKLNKTTQLTNGFSDNLDARSIQRSLVKEAMTFNPNDWICRQVSEDLYLMIPTDYLKKIETTYASWGKKYDTSTFTSAELTSGLKINHLKEIPSAALIEHFQTLVIEKPDPSNYFVQSLSSIFITRAEYSHARKAAQATAAGKTVEKLPFTFSLDTDMPQWAIYLAGHGWMEQTVANLSIEKFKMVLAFLEKDIVTKLFIYFSCYSAGTNIDLVYNDTTTNIQKTYPYAIAISALTDAMIWSRWPVVKLSNFTQPDIDFTQKNLKIKTSLSFDSFINQITNPATDSHYTTLLSTIFPDLNTAKTENIQQLPQLKLPGIPWFNIVDSANKVVSIGTVLAQTRKAPLDITRFFKKKRPIGLLLYARYMPFTIIMKEGMIEMPAIVSMIPGNAFHYIEKIATNFWFDQLFEAFQKVTELLPRKIFWINEIEAANMHDFIPGAPNGTYITINEVVFDLQPNNNQIFFTYEGNFYKISGTKPAEKISEDYGGQYNDLLGQDATLQAEVKKAGATENLEAVQRRKLEEMRKKASEEKKSDLKTAYKKSADKKDKKVVAYNKKNRTHQST